MRYRVSFFVAVAFAVAASGTSALSAANVLLGQWHLKQQVLNPNYETDTCARTDLAFLPDRFGVAKGGQWSVQPVSGYDVSNPSHIFVHAVVATEGFMVTDQNTIWGIEGPTKCIYTRTQ